MHKETKFSIALPVYNGGNHLKLCIQSILNQTDPNFKLLIFNSVNNTDGSTEFINSIVDSRIKIFQATSILNIEQNWARFINEFDSEFATIIGQDDIYANNFLEEMNKLIEKYPDASLWHSHFIFIDKMGNTIRQCRQLPTIESPDNYLKSVLQNKADSMGTGYIFRSKDYVQIGGIPLYPNLLFADLTLWLKLSDLSYKVNSDAILFSFRIHDSTTSLSSPAIYYKSFKMFLEFLQLLGYQKIEYKNNLEKYILNYLAFYAEIISFKIIRAKKAGIIEKEPLTVRYLLSSLNQFLKNADITSIKKVKWSLKTKMTLLINSVSFLQKGYQSLKKTLSEIR